MDLILVHPPHLIALACIYIASVLRDKDANSWFEELRVDMNVVSESSKLKLGVLFFGHLSSLYRTNTKAIIKVGTLVLPANCIFVLDH